MIIQHQLFLRDYQRRVDFCNWFRARPARFHDRDLLIGDEAAFKMDGKANTWNVRSYTPKNQPPANFNFKRIAIRERSRLGSSLRRLSNCRTILF